ncbi:MAG: hypothetical protein WCZ66_00970 [Sphingomonadaceae bacterium]
MAPAYPRSGGRGVAYAVAALPFLVLGLLFLFHDRGTNLFPDLEPAAVAHIELSHRGSGLRLERREDGWILPSAANAPGDTARIERLLLALTHIAGEPLATEDTPRTAPLTVILRDSGGKILGIAAFRNGEAARLISDGTVISRLSIAQLPALPLWPSAWSSLEPPAIPRDSVRQIWLTGGAAPMAMNAADTATVANILSRLSAQNFVIADDLDWQDARQLRVQLTDGAMVDVQAVQQDDRWFVRLSSDARADIRAASAFAFAAPEPLP